MEMTSNPTQRNAPPACVIRPARAEDVAEIARVHVDTWRSTYVGIVPDDFLTQLSYERREAMWGSVIARPDPRDHLFVADLYGRVIGFTSGGPLRESADPDAGEIFAIYLRREFHGRGICAQMFRASVSALRRDGFRSLRLWALEENPTCGFYRDMGGKVCGEKTETIGGRALKELFFEWSPLPTLG
jgi:GNAT superfamily N-acetyltransferase